MLRKELTSDSVTDSNRLEPLTTQQSVDKRLEAIVMSLRVTPFCSTHAFRGLYAHYWLNSALKMA